ncbi:MAG TPA: hypothetical protein VES69_14250, partial [Pyrinomonadaceae bacterium]|nr:hypothetical protein [Pyrinomonadaceae bacterium]
MSPAFDLPAQTRNRLEVNINIIIIINYNQEVDVFGIVLVSCRILMQPPKEARPAQSIPILDALSRGLQKE